MVCRCLTMALNYFLSFLVLSHLLVLLRAVNGNTYSEKCPASFDCGFPVTHFPFTTKTRPECGLFMIDGCENASGTKKVQLEKGGRWFEVINIFQQDNIIWIFDELLQKNLQSRNCIVFNNNFTLPLESPLASFEILYNATLFRCNRNLSLSPPTKFSKVSSCREFDIFYSSAEDGKFLSPSSKCSVSQLPTKRPLKSSDPFTFLSPELLIEVRLSEDCRKCYHDKGGQCKLDSKRNFYCIAGGKNQNHVFIVLAAAVTAGFATTVFLTCFFRRKLSSMNLTFFRKKKNSSHQLFKAFLKNHGPLPTSRYSYSDIKKMTSCFRDKIGQGGYGSVYKGKLRNGHLVAVKVLDKSTDNGEEFINEVASISKTSHVNIVSLLGFCFQDSKRALVYEFMPNGSLEKFINKENTSKVDCRLDWKATYDIVVGIAHGLEYLHKGCNTRIVHFDIKPHNILLDENFCPKISDFGLAKICHARQSVISMMGPRGTIGYIAPEVFSRTFGDVSHKSDIYSFGMMVLDLAGGRRNNNVETESTSETFPDWIYKCLESNKKLELENIDNDDDKEIMRKMIIVGLWCIQTRPSDRPPMNKVVDMLERKVDSIEIPPKPSFSPSTSRTLLSTSFSID